MPAELSLFTTRAETPAKSSPSPRRPAAASTTARPAPPGPAPEPDPAIPSEPEATLPPVIATEEGKLLLTEREAAKVLSVCPRTLWQLRNDGHIPCVRIGRSVRYRPADLHAWVAGHPG